MTWKYGVTFGGWPAMPHSLSNGPADDATFTLFQIDRAGIGVALDVNPDLHRPADAADLLEEFLAELARLGGADRPHD
jgi:hypothetical protein